MTVQNSEYYYKNNTSKLPAIDSLRKVKTCTLSFKSSHVRLVI